MFSVVLSFCSVCRLSFVVGTIIVVHAIFFCLFIDSC